MLIQTERILDLKESDYISIDLSGSNNKYDYEKVRAAEGTVEWANNLKICLYLDYYHSLIEHPEQFHSCRFVEKEMEQVDHCQNPITLEKALELGIPIHGMDNPHPESQFEWYYVSDLMKALGIHPNFIGFNPFV
jgi:hypothetical protein